MSYSQKYIHASNYKPRVIPVHSTVVAADLDRVQRLTLGFSRPNEKLYELGRVNEMARNWMRPEVTGSLVMNEYGDIKPFGLFSHQTAPTSVSLEQLKDKKFDIMALKKQQDADTLLATRFIPDCYLSGFNLNIADADAKLEQTFNFVAEKHLTFLGANKYVKSEVLTIAVGAATLSETPVVDPDNAGKYAIKAYNVTKGLDLVEGASDDFTIVGTALTVVNATNMANADKIQLVYSSTTIKDFAAVDDSNAYYIPAKYCTIELWEGGSSLVTVKRLQSIGVAVTFNRTPYSEIGNKNIIARAVDTINVVVTLGELISDETLDQYLVDDDGSHAKIDIENYLDTRDLHINIFDSDKKDNFLAQYIIRNLKVTGGNIEGGVNAALTGGRTLEADNMIYTNVEVAS